MHRFSRSVIRFPRLLLLPAICLAIAASGCITAITTLKVRPDGSGTLEQSMSMSAAMAAQFTQMTQLGDATAAGGKASAPPELFSEKEMKDAAAKYGEGVVFMSSRPIKTADHVGRVAVYQFADITKVHLNQKPSAGDKAAAMSGPDKPEDVLFRFAKQPAGTSLLTVVFPEPQINQRKKAGETPPAVPKPDPAKLAMAKKLFEDLKVEISVDVLGSIVKTNSPYVQGSKVTLLEMDFSQLLDNDQLLGQVTQPGSIEEAKKLLQGVKGFKVNLDREVTIEFR
jgi:hypothetical protein